MTSPYQLITPDENEDIRQTLKQARADYRNLGKGKVKHPTDEGFIKVRRETYHATPEQAALIEKMRREKQTLRAIADKLNERFGLCIDHTTVAKWCQKHRIPGGARQRNKFVKGILDDIESENSIERTK